MDTTSRPNLQPPIQGINRFRKLVAIMTVPTSHGRMRLRQLSILAVACFVLLFTVNPTHAEALKKVLILDVINLDKEANFEYLVGSITDALKENLKQNFVYVETPKEEWQKAATANDLVFTDESHTRTYSLDLGIVMKQDITISGGFKVRTRKGTQLLEVTIFLLDVKSRRLIDTIAMETPTSGEMFSKINKLADQLSIAAAKVLPGKDDYEKNKSDFGGGDRSLTITTRTKPLTVFGLRKFDETDQLLRPSQYSLSFEAGARYEINNFWRRYGLWGQGAVFFSPMALESVQRTQTISSLTFGLIALGGASMVFDISRKFHIVPRVGVGYMGGYAKLDASNYGKQAFDSSGNLSSNVNAIFFGPLVLLSGDAQYDINARLFIEGGLSLQTFFNSKGVSMTAGVNLGTGWRF